MAETPFNNDVSQAERRRIISEERAQRGVTFHQFGLLDQGPGGRFAKQEQKRSVTGEAGVLVYPALPESSPWRQWPPEPAAEIRSGSMSIGNGASWFTGRNRSQHQEARSRTLSRRGQVNSSSTGSLRLSRRACPRLLEEEGFEADVPKAKRRLSRTEFPQWPRLSKHTRTAGLLVVTGVSNSSLNPWLGWNCSPQSPTPTTTSISKSRRRRLRP